MMHAALRGKPGAENPHVWFVEEEFALAKPRRSSRLCKRILLGILTCGLAVAAGAADSVPSFVLVNPKTSSFWHTALSNVVTLPIDYPEGATTATLTVAGIGYEQVYTDITADSFELTLPADVERSYQLTLAFDKGESQSAQISVLAGSGDAASGSTRCLTSNLRAWPRTDNELLLLPIPAGVTSLTLNGETVDTGLGGDQGFCSVMGLPASLVLTAGETTSEVTVERTPGCYLILR